MSAFAKYSNYYNSGENLPAKVLLDMNVVIGEGRSASKESREALVKWAKRQNSWSLQLFLNAFCKSYMSCNSTNGFMDLLKCVYMPCDEMNLKDLVNAITFNCLTTATSTLRTSRRTADLIVGLYTQDIMDEGTFVEFFCETLKSPMPGSQRTSMLKTLLPPAVIVKLRSSRADGSILLNLKATVATNEGDHESIVKSLQSLVKCGLFSENDINLKKESQIARIIIHHCNNPLGLNIAVKLLTALGITNNNDIGFIGFLIFKLAMEDSMRHESLAFLIKKLKEGVYKNHPLFMQTIFDDLMGHAAETLPSMGPRVFMLIHSMVGFIGTVFDLVNIGGELVMHCLEILHRPENEAELNRKDPNYLEYKKSCFTTLFRIVHEKLTNEQLYKFTLQQHDFDRKKMDKLSKKMAEMNKIVEEQKEAPVSTADEEIQEATAQPETLKKSKKRRLKKNRKSMPKKAQSPAQGPNEVQEPALVPGEAQEPKEGKQTAPAPQADEPTATTPNAIKELPGFKKTLKKTVFGLKTEQKFQAFIEAILKNSSIYIETTLKDIEEMKSICDNSTDRRQLMFKTALTNALAEVFAEIKKSKLYEQTQSTISKLAIVYAKAYKWKLISTRAFCRLLRQKCLKVLSVDTLKAISEESHERLNNNPNDEKKKVVKLLKALITRQKDLAIAVSLKSNIKTINTDDVMKDIEETASRFTEIFSVDEITLPEFYTPFCL